MEILHMKKTAETHPYKSEPFEFREESWDTFLSSHMWLT